MLNKIILNTLWILCFVAPCRAQTRAIHTMFLQQSIPAQGIEVAINTPILRWPYQKGKDIKYAIQLSQDSSFTGPNAIEATGLTGAIFNAHRSLEPGRWYWRHKVEGKNWSPFQYFLVADQSINIVSPPASTMMNAIPVAHPRILLDHPQDDIKKLSSNLVALAIIKEANFALSQKILTEADALPATKAEDEKQNNKLKADAIVALGNTVHNMVLTLCQAYLLTGQQSYATKAITMAIEISRWDPKGISGSRDFTDGVCMYDMALVFDTFYDQLTAEQRNILVKASKVRAAGFYKSWVNNIESKVLSGHVWQLILNEFFKTSIALYGHEPDAAQWLGYSYELFLDRAPVLGGLDGGWAEGASYFQMNMETMVDIPDKIKIYTGFDLFRSHPWYTHQADWMIYQVPPQGSADGFGDNTEELHTPPASFAAYAEVMAALTQNPKFVWYLDRLNKPQHPDFSKEPILRWYRLTHNSKAQIPVLTDSIHWPMAAMFQEVGVAALHTHLDRSDKDIMVAMRASPFGAYGHILSDQNTFNIMVGGKRLFYRTGYKVAMDDPHRVGWSKHTKSQNGVLINGEGQPYSAEAYGYFTRILQGDQLAYIKGDASNAYQSAETKEDYGMKKFYRHIVLLKPDIVVIYDELEAEKEAQWSWLIHSLKHMAIDTMHQTFTASIDDVRGVGKLWSDQSLTWNLTDEFEVPAVQYRNYKGMRNKNYVDDQWHLKVSTKGKVQSTRYLTVIQLGKSGTPIKQFNELEKSDGKIKVSIGDWIVEATLTADRSPQLTVNSDAHQTSFTAYGSEIKAHQLTYPGKLDNSSKLVETIDGKIKFTEAGDRPMFPLR